MDIPKIGLGTWQLTGQECSKAVAKAIELGYRHLDSADGYGNHQEVAKGIKASGINREDLFITTKVPRVQLDYDDVIASCDRYLSELGTEYIDLLLIHWPNKEVPIEETLEAFERLKQQEKIRLVGVSNFTIHHLEDIKAKGFKVVNNQIELHPQFNQSELVEYCQTQEISVTAYSPIGRGSSLNLPEVQELAQKYSKTPSQIILRWITARGVIAIPKSTNPQHLKENFQIFDFELTEEDMNLINRIKQEERLVNPATSEFNYWV